MTVRLLSDERIPCPECMKEGSLGWDDPICTDCGRRASADYLRSSRAQGLTAIQVFGWPSHGKSTFLAALTLVLSRIGVIWPGCFCSPLTERSQRKLRELNTYFETGALPPPTTVEGETVLLLLKNAGPWAERLIAYRDCPGEWFDNYEVDVDRIPLLRRAPALFLVLSSRNLSGVAAGGRSMDMLMGSLVHALEEGSEVQSPREKRSAIVVLTKADVIPDLPTSVRSYLLQDKLWSSLISVRSGEQRRTTGDRSRELMDEPGTDVYRERMATVSDTLRAWIENEPAGCNLVRIAEDHDLSLRFCAVSATGSQPDENGYLSAAWHPRRVIDPLLWALEFDPRRLTLLDQESTRSSRWSTVRFDA